MLERINKLNIRLFFSLFVDDVSVILFFLTICRDTIMAAVANSAHQKRTRPRGLVPADISRHHRTEATHRNGRQQRRSLQVRQTRQISHQIEIGPSFSIQLPSAGLERDTRTDHHQTIASGSCKSLCDAL